MASIRILKPDFGAIFLRCALAQRNWRSISDLPVFWNFDAAIQEDRWLDTQFWLDKWQNRETGFHLSEVNSVLIRCWPTLGLESGRVLVPLCGKSLDVVWLLQQGYEVTGIELSPVAIADLRRLLARELGIVLSEQQCGEHRIYQHPRVTLIEGDFFSLPVCAMPAPVAAVYDRAAMVALPEPMREHYRQQLMRLAPGVPQLLVTLEYDQTLNHNPPFAVMTAELIASYGSYYRLHLQREEELIDEEPRFRSKGLTSFIQKTWLLTPA